MLYFEEIVYYIVVNMLFCESVYDNFERLGKVYEFLYKDLF